MPLDGLIQKIKNEELQSVDLSRPGDYLGVRVTDPHSMAPCSQNYRLFGPCIYDGDTVKFSFGEEKKEKKEILQRVYETWIYTYYQIYDITYNLSSGTTEVKYRETRPYPDHCEDKITPEPFSFQNTEKDDVIIEKYSAKAKDKKITVREKESRKILCRIEAPSSPYSLQLAGDLLFSTHASDGYLTNRYIYVWNINTGNLLSKIPFSTPDSLHKQHLSDFYLLQDKKDIQIITFDVENFSAYVHSYNIWDVLSGKKIRTHYIIKNRQSSAAVTLLGVSIRERKMVICYSSSSSDDLFHIKLHDLMSGIVKYKHLQKVGSLTHYPPSEIFVDARLFKHNKCLINFKLGKDGDRQTYEALYVVDFVPTYTEEEIIKIFNALKFNTSVVTLNLSNINFTKNSMDALEEILGCNIHIKELILINTNLNDRLQHSLITKLINMQTNRKLTFPENFFTKNSAILKPSQEHDPSQANVQTMQDKSQPANTVTWGSEYAAQPEIAQAQSNKSQMDLVTIDYENELTILNSIGKGGYGIVYKAMWKQKTVAVKKLMYENISEDALEEIEKEAQFIAKIQSPYIISILGISKNPPSLVLEFMEYGSLYDMIHNKKASNHWSWEDSTRYQLAYDISAGLEHLHRERIMHRDLKSLNILLYKKDNLDHAKITDFGMAKAKRETTSTITTTGMVGTFAWMAPELAENKSFTTKSDIFSLAIVLWEMAALALPYQDVQAPMMIPLLVINGRRENIPDDCPTPYTEVIKSCWQLKPEDRPSASEVKERLTQAATVSKIGLFTIQNNHHLALQDDGSLQESARCQEIKGI